MIEILKGFEGALPLNLEIINRYQKHCNAYEKYTATKLEQIKDILPGEKNIELFFEVYKKGEEKEDHLVAKICDETGIADAIFGATIKKYIEENQVYTAKFAEAVVIDEHIRLELMK